MDGIQITKEYIDMVRKDSLYFYNDYIKTVEAVENSNAKYKGKPVPFLYQPMFYTEEDIEKFKDIGRILMSITNKVTKKYLESPSFREKFGYSKLLEELILTDHGYDMNVPIGRFDIFYGGGDQYKFCELNTDGSSAMNEDNTLARILLETEPISKMKDKYDIQYFELIDQWVDESIKIYKEFNSKIEKPNVAIVDFENSGTPAEFEEFKKAYIKKGYKAEIADPRELKYIDGKLYFNDFKIDMIYRRIVTREFIEKSEDIQDLINAYRDKAVCVIGPIKSQIMHNKIIFKILHDKDTLEILSQEEQEYVKKHIPFTKIFHGDKEIFEEALKNKDNYIIKPMDLYASQGVYAGRDYTETEWRRKLDECWEKDYLLQEFCKLFTRPFVHFEDTELKVSEFGHIIGLFMYNEKLAGLYTRIGQNNIISGLHGYYTVPNLLIRKKIDME